MERVRFEDIVTRVNTKEDRFNTDKIYYVGGEHIESNDIKVHQRGIIKGSTIGPMFYCGFKAGDVLFVTRNPHLRKCAVVDFDGICSEKTFVLGTKDSSRLLQEYLPLIMQSDDFWAYCEENKSGGVNFFVNWSTLANYEFELPSLEEQRVLADKLWAAYEVKESYKNLLAQTDKLLHAQFQKMFGDIEKTVPLKTCANVITGSTPSKSRPEYWNNGTYYWVSAFDMKEKYIKDTLEKVTQKGYDTCRKLPIGSILYVCRGSIGVMAINSVECACNQSICAATCHENWDNEFIYYVLKYCSENIQKQYGEGTSFKSISQSTFMNLPIPDVPYNAQVEFREFIEQAELTKASLNKGIEAIEAVIRSLIAEGTTKL